MAARPKLTVLFPRTPLDYIISIGAIADGAYQFHDSKKLREAIGTIRRLCYECGEAVVVRRGRRRKA